VQFCCRSVLKSLSGLSCCLLAWFCETICPSCFSLPGENNVMQFSLQSRCTAHRLNAFFSLGLVVSPSGGLRAGSANDNKDIMYYCLIVDLPMVSLCRVKSKDRGQACFFVFFFFFFFAVLTMFPSNSQGVP
jgi:hypothetical protein